MANQMAQDEILLDIRVAEASAFYKFYLNQEKKIQGTVAVILPCEHLKRPNSNLRLRSKPEVLIG